jgi:N-acetylmuramoyl-L-alanine amidase
MATDPAFTRRFMLGQGFGAALLLPAAARAEPPRHAPKLHPAPPKPVVVIDAGHGGKDPGAIGISGTYEKHVALAAAGELARQLLATGRYRVALTRDSDFFIPLEGRVEIARLRGAALFMSLHADAMGDHTISGASVYTLSSHASDAQSALLAMRENAVDRFGAGHGVAMPRQVVAILDSLVQHETRVGSARIQHRIVASLGTSLPMLENSARQAAFAVLKATDIPSVLIEMGFMSNPSDEAALRRPAHRATVAAAIRRAVDGYFGYTTA